MTLPLLLLFYQYLLQFHCQQILQQFHLKIYLLKLQLLSSDPISCSPESSPPSPVPLNASASMVYYPFKMILPSFSPPLGPSHTPYTISSLSSGLCRSTYKRAKPDVMNIQETTTKTYGSVLSHNLESNSNFKIQYYDDTFSSHSVHQWSPSTSSSNQSTDSTAPTSTFFNYATS